MIIKDVFGFGKEGIFLEFIMGQPMVREKSGRFTHRCDRWFKIKFFAQGQRTSS